MLKTPQLIACLSRAVASGPVFTGPLFSEHALRTVASRSHAFSGKRGSARLYTRRVLIAPRHGAHFKKCLRNSLRRPEIKRFSWGCMPPHPPSWRADARIKYITDPFGDHHVGCGGNNDRISRHDSIRDAVFSAAQSAALAPRKEVPCLIPDRQSRPADVFLPHWKRGLPAALDVSVISTLQPRTCQGASETQGFALSVCEERKIAAHAASCRAIGVSFVPLAFESLGGCSKLTAETLAGIGRAVGQRLGIPPPTASRQLFLSLCGGGTPLCGCIAFQLPHLSLTVLFDFCYNLVFHKIKQNK